MISDALHYFVDAAVRMQQELFCAVETNLLKIVGVGQTSFSFDQPVKIICLKMKNFYQLLNCDGIAVLLDIRRNFFKNNPIHGIFVFL